MKKKGYKDVLACLLLSMVSKGSARVGDTWSNGSEGLQAHMEQSRGGAYGSIAWMDRIRAHEETSQYQMEDFNLSRPTCAWMEELYPELELHNLFELTMPGTHNAGAYLLSNDLMPGDWGEKSESMLKVAEFLHIPVEDVIIPWSLTQDGSVLKQLELGSRYLDVRAGWNGKEWRTFHLEQGVLITDILADLVTFLEKHPMEIVYLEVSHLVGSPTAKQVRRLADAVVKICGPLLIPTTTNLQQATFKELTMSGKRILASLSTTRSILSDYQQIWPGYTFFNTYANTDDLERMVKFNQRATDWFRRYHTQLRSNTFLYKISWTLTPQVHTIVDSILTRNPRNLYTLAKNAAQHFEDFDVWLKDRKMQGGNIILFDYLDLVLSTSKNCTGIVSLVKSINRIFPQPTLKIPTSL